MMTFRAFIPARRLDYDMAQLCANHMRKLGWVARILIDPDDWVGLQKPHDALPASYAMNKKMFGTACALGVVNGMLKYSFNDDVVLRMDCDVRITPSTSKWLMFGTGGKCLRVDRKNKNLPWGGLWSARRNHLPEMIQHLKHAEDCNCPETVLCLNALSKCDGGLEVHDESVMVREWLPSMENADALRDNHDITLLIAKIINRQEAGLAMFK